jgi:hypothetical protein
MMPLAYKYVIVYIFILGVRCFLFITTQGLTLTVVRLPEASEMHVRASENDSVICSIPEEQND